MTNQLDTGTYEEKTYTVNHTFWGTTGKLERKGAGESQANKLRARVEGTFKFANGEEHHVYCLVTAPPNLEVDVKHNIGEGQSQITAQFEFDRVQSPQKISGFLLLTKNGAYPVGRFEADLEGAGSVVCDFEFWETPRKSK